MKRLRVVALWTFPLFVGCAAFHIKPKPSVLPAYMHRIAVRAFTNHTQVYGLEDKLTLAIQSEFNRDGRYQLSGEDQADGVVSGDITKYILEPLSYDVNHVPTEYKLTLLVTVSFDDKVKTLKVWTEPDMVGELRYYVASSGFAGSLTEDDARLTIYDQLSRDIAKRTFEGTSTPPEGGNNKVGTGFSTAPINGIPPVNPNPPAVPDPNPPAPTRLPY